MPMLAPDLQKEEPQDLLGREYLRETPTSEYLGARFRQGLDWTFLKQGITESMTATEEIGEDPLTEPQWKESEYYRDKIKFNDFTPARAKAYAEEFDRRRYDEWLVQRGNPGTFGTIAGYGAMFAAQALDPINYIPFVGVAGKIAKGAKLGKVALKAGKAVKALGPIRGRMAVGAVEAVGGTILSDAYIIPALRAQGEDVGWTDFALDVTAGAAIGAAFGGVSGLIKEKMRGSMTKADKISVARALEKSISDYTVDRPVDVGELIDAPKTIESVLAKFPDEGLNPKPKLEIDTGRFQVEPEFTPEARAAVESATKVEPPSAHIIERAKSMGIDPKTLEFPELKDLEYLKETDGITLGEKDSLMEADQLIKNSERYETAYQFAAYCLMGRG